jgi:hypothetical protein
MTFNTLLSCVTAALICVSTIQAYVLPFQASEKPGDLVAAHGGRLHSRSLNSASDGSISVPIYRRHGDLHPDKSKRDPNKTRNWAFRQRDIMKSKYSPRIQAHAANTRRQTIGLVDVGQDR